MIPIEHRCPWIFFQGGGSKRPPRISKKFFRGGPGGPGGKQGVNRILEGEGPLGGRFRGSRGSVVLGGLGGRFLSDKAHISSFKCLQSL